MTTRLFNGVMMLGKNVSVVASTILLLMPTIAQAAIPGEKLLDTSNYGRDEYLICVLAIFVGFVAVKHLIFHTMYFWWFTNGRFFIPNMFWSLVTGKNFCERLYSHVVKNMKENGETSKIDQLIQSIDDYCENVEFAPNFGPQKGEILVSTMKENQGVKHVLMIGSSYGYVMLTLLKMMPLSDEVVLYIVDEDVQKMTLLTKLSNLVGRKIHTICKPITSVLSQPRDHFSDVIKFDMVYTTRTSHHQSSYVDVLKLMETNQLVSDGTVILADKVVFYTDPQYLMYVRESTNYINKYHQMALEHNTYDILDGIEISQFHKPTPTGGDS